MEVSVVGTQDLPVVDIAREHSDSQVADTEHSD